jgi:DNA-binding PucR family transcriptional regulator
MKAKHKLGRKARSPLTASRERTAWLKRKEALIQWAGSISKAAALLGCHPNSLRNINACPGIKAKLEEELS